MRVAAPLIVKEGKSCVKVFKILLLRVSSVRWGAFVCGGSLGFGRRPADRSGLALGFDQGVRAEGASPALDFFESQLLLQLEFFFTDCEVIKGGSAVGGLRAGYE
ncbi:MAG: hypothetical protein OXS35_01715 [Dehalococcoidia bacterium]|nr:hypothetical protein [Dehalococcoidia bacterium]